MLPSRRHVLKTGAAAGLLPFAPAWAQGGRPLKVNLLGFALGIHVPSTAALLAPTRIASCLSCE